MIDAIKRLWQNDPDFRADTYRLVAYGFASAYLGWVLYAVWLGGEAPPYWPAVFVGIVFGDAVLTTFGRHRS